MRLGNNTDLAEAGADAPLQAGNPAQVCAGMADILNRIGDKWSVMVVGFLSRKTMRFNELRHAIGGISQRMLTLTLRNLERDGLVTRTVYPEIPPRVEYTLTDLGHTLTEPLDALWTWAAEHQGEVQQARMGYDAAHVPAGEQHPPERRYAGAVR
jgi:DNA-binding HxlR family transcriptional regulator